MDDEWMHGVGIKYSSWGHHVLSNEKGEQSKMVMQTGSHEFKIKCNVINHLHSIFRLIHKNSNPDLFVIFVEHWGSAAKKYIAGEIHSHLLCG